MTDDILMRFGENKILTLDDVGDLASDELIELLEGFEMNEDEANEVIMAARAHWFDDEPESGEAAEAE